MNFEEFKDDIITQLGGGIVDVELDDAEIRLAFKKAKKTFQQKGHNNYRRQFFKLPVTPCRSSYQLPSNVHTVVKIIKPTMGFNLNDEFSIQAYNQIFGYSQSTTGGDWLSHEFILQKIELWERYLAHDVQFDHDEFSNTLTAYKAPERNGIWLIECYSNLTDDEYMNVLWVQEWAAAEAKQMLGNAYRKFPSLPGPDGAISLDGNSLIQEAKAEKEALLQDILDGVDGGVDFYEIVFG